MAKHQKKRRKTTASNAVVFAVTFLVFLVVFGGLCLWVVVRMNEEKRSNDASSGATNLLSNHAAAAFTAEDARNLLIITVDEGQAQGFVAVRMDPAGTSMRAAAFPRDMVVEQEAEEIRLYELYAAQGAAATRDALAEATHCVLDNYAVITYPAIKDTVDYYENGLIMEFSESLEYKDDTLNIQLPAGHQYLTSSQVLDVLRYPAWRGGRKQRADIQAQVVAALINQYMREARIAKADEDFSAMVNHLLTTDIRRQHFHAARAGLDYLAGQNTGALCTTKSVAGSYVGSGDALRFVYDDTDDWQA